MLVTEPFARSGPAAVMFHERRLRMGLKLTLDAPNTSGSQWSQSAASTPAGSTPCYFGKARTPTSLSAANTPASPSTHLDILQSLTLQGHTPAGTPTADSAPGFPSSSSITPNKPVNGPKAILPEELAKRMRRPKPFLLLDCRSEFSYRMSHIYGAMHVNINDRLTRRRLQGKASLSDLMTTKDSKALYRKRVLKEVVIYDDKTMDWTGLPAVNPMQLLLSCLKNDGKDPAVLIGGFTDFQTQFHELCDGTAKRAKLSPDAPTGPLTSPTNSSHDDVDLEKVEASQVLPFLFLGNERDAADMERIANLKVSYILNVTSHTPCYYERDGIRYKRLPASDSGQQNLLQYFEEAFKFIDEARQSDRNVLIHCQAGVSRSATIVVAYVMHHCNMTMNEAYKLVKAKRSVISPNLNFMGQLVEYEEVLKKLESIEEGDCTDAAPAAKPESLPGKPQQRITSIETSL